MEWIRGVDKGNGQRQWVKGMESALFNAKATRCGGWCVRGLYGFMEQWESPFVPSVPFQPASGLWLMACGDFFVSFLP